MVLFEINKCRNTPKIIIKNPTRQNFIEDSEIIKMESSVPTFVHNYRIKGYKVKTVRGLL